MTKQQDINETAYWMTGCRAALPELSKDIYAKFWLNDASRERHILYTKEVSPAENITLSLRNRFFLEDITNFLGNNPNSVFINIGAGFSSYPFLMPENIRYCEVDCADVIKTKQRKVQGFNAIGTFPKRDITYFSVDLNRKADLVKLYDDLREWTGDTNSFILLEGLVYYLKLQRTNELFDIARKIQTSGSRLGVVTWLPATVNWSIYKRFEDFVKNKLGEELAHFYFHEPSEIKKIEGYSPIIQTDYIELSRKYGMKKPLKPEDDVFWEILTVLERE